MPLRENECVRADVYNLVTVDATSPIGQANTPLVKDFVRCATFSALCLIPYFKLFGIIHLPRLNYFRAAPYTLFMPVLIFTAILVLSITFTIIVRLVRRTATPRVQAVIFAASVMLLVPAARELLDRPFSTVAVTILCCIALAVLLSAQAVRAMGSVLMALSFLVPVQAASALWGYMRQPPASQFVNSFDADRSTGTSVSGRGRILWLIFDELDDELVFPLRPADVKMPELDRLRSESVYVAGATPAAGWTLRGHPGDDGREAGRIVRSARFQDTSVDIQGIRVRDLEQKSSVFSDAHAAGPLPSSPPSPPLFPLFPPPPLFHLTSATFPSPPYPLPLYSPPPPPLLPPPPSHPPLLSLYPSISAPSLSYTYSLFPSHPPKDLIDPGHLAACVPCCSRVDDVLSLPAPAVCATDTPRSTDCEIGGNVGVGAAESVADLDELAMNSCSVRRGRENAGSTLVRSCAGRPCERPGQETLRTAIVGWYHPYCRVFTTTVDHCEAYMPMTSARIATYYEALFKQVGFRLIIKRAVTLRLGDTAIGRALHMGPPFDPAYIFREEQVASYERIRTAAKKLATDPTMGFIVVHWNVPHPQGIYDRTNNRFETRNKSNYFDNLELMDAAISELRTAMTAAGVWDTTTIILTSDHPLRPKLWGARTKQWSVEEETLTQKRRRSAIPFIIKLAGHNEGITYEGSYDVFHTRELISAVRAGEVSSHSGVVSWLEKHSRTTPMAAGHRP